MNGRTQTVVLEGETSDTINVDSVVPQDSVIGPSLFIYYINDIAYGLDATVRLFTDETIAYLTVANNTCRVLDRLARWENKWKMAFYPDKCQVLYLSRKKTPSNSSTGFLINHYNMGNQRSTLESPSAVHWNAGTHQQS